MCLLPVTTDCFVLFKANTTLVLISHTDTYFYAVQRYK